MIKKILIRNKRGDIPIAILVIGVLAVCGLAIFSFFISDSKVQSDINSFGVVERAAIEMEKMLLYRELGFSEDEIGKVFDIEIDGVGQKYLFVNQSGISVEYYFLGE